MPVTAAMSVSLDGYVTGPRADADRPLGEGGAVLHDWFAHAGADRATLTGDALLAELFARLGAMVCGRDSYEHAQRAWGPEPPFGCPVVVLTHRPRPDDVRRGTTFHFVTDGFPAALARAREAAGGKDVALHGAGSVQQALRADVLDELILHQVPVLLGNGRRLLDDVGTAARDWVRVRVIPGSGVTHLHLRRRR